MSKDSQFDSEMVRTLAEILNETHLTEIEYKGPEYKIRVVRQITQAPTQTFMAPPSMPAYVTENAVTPATAPIQDLHQHPGAVKAPMVGTAYMAPTPTAAPFVSLGLVVTKGQTLMIIEAMKVMNQIKSPADGTLKQILCADGDPIEYDQLLFIIE